MIDEKIMESIEWQNVYRSKEFNEAMNWFNLNDDKTCDTLLILDEAGQEQVLQSLASKLYSFIIKRVYTIDFGEIPKSKGDFKKIPNYKLIMDCIDVLEQILEQYKQPVDKIDTIKMAINNLESRKELFATAYRLNVEMPIVTYNTIALAIISSLSLIITTHIEFIKQNDNSGYDLAFDIASKEKTRDRLLFLNLEQFNRMCSDESLDKSIKYSLDNVTYIKYQESYGSSNINNDNLEPIDEGIINVGNIISGFGNYLVSGGIGAAKTLASSAGSIVSLISSHPIVAGIIGFFAAIIGLIKLLKWLVFNFYYERTKFSDKMNAISAMMLMNALNLQNSLTKDNTSKDIVIKKQVALAKFAKKLADTIRVDSNNAEQQANKASKEFDNMKFEYKDVVEPDNAIVPEKINDTSSKSNFALF